VYYLQLPDEFSQNLGGVTMRAIWENVLEDGFLSSPLNVQWEASRVQGSLFQDMQRAAMKFLQDDPNWVFLKNFLTGETITVKEAFELGDK
jgi:hypothetical protein